MKTEPNSPANVIPTIIAANYEPMWGSDGMTILETMAMHICAGLSANPNLANNTADSIASISVEQADALIEALNNELNK